MHNILAFVAGQAPVDPADAAHAASLAAQVAPPALGSGEILLGLATVIGLLIRTVLVPALKSKLARDLFHRVPLAAQHLVILGLCGIAAALEAYGSGKNLAEAIQVALSFYGTSQLFFGLTAGRFEHRERATPKG